MRNRARPKKNYVEVKIINKNSADVRVTAVKRGTTVVTDISGQPVGPICKGSTGCLETSVTTYLHGVTTQKSEDVIYTAAEA